MKSVSQSEMRQLAELLERVARTVRLRGDEAVRRAHDWATPLRSSGNDPGRGKGQISDPTGTAALAFDPNAEELTLLSVDAGQLFGAAVSLESRVLRIATDAVIENQRAGIGHCTCGRYCDGVKDNRLRMGLCDACRKREERKTVKECPHRSTRWSNGVLSCANPECAVVLDTASAG